jgi:cobalt-zinc-cadmium efflux system membrane fusion protein
MNKFNYKTMKNWLINYLLIATVMTMASCSSSPEKLPKETATETSMESDYQLTANQFQSSGMKLGKTEVKSFHEVVKAIGMFDVPPENRASVSSYFSGVVKDIRLLPGQKVKKGQKLFVLENPDYVQMQQDYLEAKGQLKYLKSDYERQKNLIKDNVTSEKKYLKSESDFTVTSVKVESLSRKLKLMNINPNTLTVENIRTTITIFSPINGYVTEVNISRGTFLNPSQTAIAIVDTDHLHLELNIFEKDLSKVKIGQPIQFSIQEDPPTQYSASVYLINKSVNTENRKIGIHGHLSDENLSSGFNPGMYVEADIYISSESKTALPEEAIVDIDGTLYVLMLESSSNGANLFKKKEVKTGMANDGFVQILNSEDFSKDAEFLVSGAFNLIKE